MINRRKVMFTSIITEIYKEKSIRSISGNRNYNSKDTNKKIKIYINSSLLTAGLGLLILLMPLNS
jgi:hypothetical protein